MAQQIKQATQLTGFWTRNYTSTGKADKTMAPEYTRVDDNRRTAQISDLGSRKPHHRDQSCPALSRWGHQQHVKNMRPSMCAHSFRFRTCLSARGTMIRLDGAHGSVWTQRRAVALASSATVRCPKFAYNLCASLKETKMLKKI